MDNEKKSWDDIPALDLQDLQVEWDYRAEISNDKRRVNQDRKSVV